MADSVQLTDLDVITRYSIAVRTASADRDELIETLRADLAWLEREQYRGRPGRFSERAPEPEYDEPADVDVAEDAEPDVEEAEPEPPRRTPLRRMPATVRAPAAKKIAATKTTAKKAAVKKTTPRRTGR